MQHRPVLFGATLLLLASAWSQQPDHTRVTLVATPEPVVIEPQHTAMVIVDMQSDFAAKNGMFDRAGIDITPVRNIVAATARSIQAARKAGIKIIYLKMAFLPDLSDAGPHDSPNWLRHHRLHVGEANHAPDGSPSRILIRDTWDSDIIDELKPAANDIVIYKNRFSGFYNTDLDATLKRLKIKYLIFSGATTSICVESTLRDAMFRDYIPVLLTDTTAEPIGIDRPRSNYDASLLVIQRLFGWLSDSKQFSAALK